MPSRVIQKMGVVKMKKNLLSWCLSGILLVASAVAQAGVPCNETDKGLLPSKISGTAKVNLSTVRISIETPAADKIVRCAVSALEYGDMISYSFAAGSEAVATISVDHPIGFSRIEHKVKMMYIALEPTVLGDEREHYPHSIRVNDVESSMIYDLYLDHSGKVAFTRAYYAKQR